MARALRKPEGSERAGHSQPKGPRKGNSYCAASSPRRTLPSAGPWAGLGGALPGDEASGEAVDALKARRGEESSLGHAELSAKAVDE